MNIIVKKTCSCFDFSIILNIIIICFGLFGCNGNQSNHVINKESNNTKIKKNIIDTIELEILKPLYNREKIKLGHTINTSANEYLPLCSPDGKTLFFTAMDRTGFFDFKIDFTKEKSAGGEDIFTSTLKEGLWEDARPLSALNTNAHEVVTQVLPNGDLLLTGNYIEKLGVKIGSDVGVQTTDLFFARKLKNGYQINHLPEPVNSIYTESDGIIGENQSYILFVSDRPGNVGEYHKKGWKWNDSFWGNTDIYVSLMEEDNWTVPINLGSKINTAYAERTPWLSNDGLTLYLSSNGYVKGKTDLDVYAFKRASINDWTHWDGPYTVKDANSLNDDWGYKEILNGNAFFASANKLGFKPTQGGVAGDGGIRQTNFRPGYAVYGLQVASINAEYETNIYELKSTKSPIFIASDLFFDFNSITIKKSFEIYLLQLVDLIKQNKESTIEIFGHTDNIGNYDYNLQLSKNRADAVKKFLLLHGVNNPFVTKGFGDQNPAFPNTSESNRQKNRRVEVFIKNGGNS